MDLVGLKGRRERTAQPLAVGSRVSQTGAGALPQNLAFELSEGRTPRTMWKQ